MVKGTDQTSGRKGQFQLQRTEIFCEMPRVLVEENVDDVREDRDAAN